MHASDKADSKNPVIGQGEHRYECFHGWGEVPSSIHWFETHGVAIDKAGFIYIKHRAGGQKPKSPDQAQDTIVVFDPDGKFVRSFGKEYHGGGHGIDIREENGQEFLYLSCMMPVNLVVKTDMKGEVVWIKEAPDGAARLRQARNAVRADQRGLRPRRRLLRRRWLRLELYPPIRQGRQVGPDLRRHGRRLPASSRPRTGSGSTTAPAASRCSSLPIAPMPGSSTCPSTAQPKSIDHDVSFPAHFDIRGDVLLVPDLHARVTLFDKDNNVIVHLGYDPEWTKQVLDGFKIRIPAQPLAGRQVHPSARCLLRQGWQYLRRRVGPDRPGFAAQTRGVIPGRAKHSSLMSRQS